MWFYSAVMNGMSCIFLWCQSVKSTSTQKYTEVHHTYIPQLMRPGSGLLLWDRGCWEMMRECLLGGGRSRWAESIGRDKVLQYLTEVSAIFMISLHTASYWWKRVGTRGGHKPGSRVSHSDGKLSLRKGQCG